MNPGIFSHDDDGDDIVTLRAADSEEVECSGWVNIGQHAVHLSLDPNGNLCVETFAQTRETHVLGSVRVPRLVTALALLGDRPVDPLTAFVDDLVELGFDKDESISGADLVDVVARYYPTLRVLADEGEHLEGEGQ